MDLVISMYYADFGPVINPKIYMNDKKDNKLLHEICTIEIEQVFIRKSTVN